VRGKKEDMTIEQSAKKRQMSVAVRKELLSLRHRFGEMTSCEGRLTTQFRLVNSGKILSRDEKMTIFAGNNYIKTLLDCC
jgi:hypothetical protein